MDRDTVALDDVDVLDIPLTHLSYHPINLPITSSFPLYHHPPITKIFHHKSLQPSIYLHSYYTPLTMIITFPLITPHSL